MSDVIGLARSLIPAPIAALLGEPGWRANLLPASFRGATFRVLDHEFITGRRVAVHEFPLRDTVETEDLGRVARRFRIGGYIIGPDYWAERDAFLAACEQGDEPGRLVHPYLGEWQVRCEGVTLREVARDGNIAILDCVFVEAGPDAAPQPSRVATIPRVLAQARRVLSLARSAFALTYGVKDLGGFIRAGASSWLNGLGETLAARWLGLPGLDLEQVRAEISGLGAPTPAELDAPDELVVAPFGALAALDPGAGLLASGADAEDRPGSAAATSRAEGASPATWTADLLLEFGAYAGAPAEAGADVLALRDAANRAALAALCRDAAVASACQVLAGTAWPSADAAAAARDRIADAILARMDQAAEAGADALYQGWRALLAAVTEDLAERGTRLPRLVPYAVPAALPALALAQRLHQDARRADRLVALNAAPHPCFMPLAGVTLR